jgi:hypothetical protein
MSEPTLADVLAAVERIEDKVDGIEVKLEAEVKRWDERFFKFAEDTANRANTLIASATIVLRTTRRVIAVIAGTLLLILREGSQP